jgi:hypothetical protein
MLIIGVYFPSSLEGEISTTYEAMFFVPLALCLIPLFLMQTNYNKDLLVLMLIINFSLVFYTVVTYGRYDTRSWGSYPYYLFLSLAFCLDLKSVTYTGLLKYALIITLIGQIVLSYGIFSENDILREFLLEYYSSGYPELLYTMMGEFKPVTTFATHSVAAFFHFIFFFLSLQSYRVFGNWYWLVFATISLLLLITIRSNTSIAYTVISLIVLFKGLSNKPRILALFAITLILLVGGLVYYFKDLIQLMLDANIITIMAKDNNGLLSRYQAEGNYLEPTINYLKENPLLSIGINYDPKLFYTDSGFIIYFLRGSLPLLVSIYLGFYMFLEKNMLSRRLTLFLFLSFMAFEFGYPNLISSRTVCCLPFIIVYLNYLEKEKSDA